LNFPSFPTDSLYKFMAIAGLIAIVAGESLPFVISERYFERLSNDRQSFNDNMQKHLFEFTHIANDASNLAHPTDASLDAKIKLLDIMGDHFKTITQRAIDSSDRDLNALSTSLVMQIKKLELLTRVGSAVMFAGFFLWWLKVQRFQDAILRKEAGAVTPRRRIRWPRPFSRR